MGSSRLLYALCSISLLAWFVVVILDDVAKDVVEDKVSVELLSEDKGLGELAVRLGLVGDLADDLDDNVGAGSLGVDVGDTDLAVLKVELLYAVVDGL